MALILHLSDLHLGTPSGWQMDYADKFGLDSRSAGDTQIDHLRRTLGAVGNALATSGRTLDAIVVSGDLTKANAADGYAEFRELLGELGSAKPDDDRIVVAPGNHDTDWNKRPGDPAKFKRFLDAVRAPYRSPLIGGLDYDAETLQRKTGSRPKAQPILDLEDTVVVAFNSADFCGIEEDRTKSPWPDIVGAYRSGDESDEAKAARKLAEDELRGLRVHDMARVDKRQLDAMKIRLAACGLDRPAEFDARVRVAVLHHPIGPVSKVEEIKSFESLTNLEQVRSFLYFHGFHVVLHGHKHASYLGWDWLLPSGDDLTAIPWRALIIGSPGDFRPGETVSRLIETSPDGDRPVAGAPRLRVIAVVGVRPAEAAKLKDDQPCISLAQPFVGSTEVGMPWVVQARTADSAYQQLRDLPSDPDVPRPVVSVVEDAASALTLPVNYPEQQDARWLDSLVRWWQHEHPKAVQAFTGSSFNHGERLYGSDDAIRRAAEALPSTKAIALLFGADEAGHVEREFPSLTAVQLHATRRPEGGTRLDAVGIYRKQDLSRWWPVNMAELAYIQQKAVGFAEGNSDLEPPVVAGRLVAMATVGLHDTVLPQMAGTVLDRAVDLRPEWLHRLAYLAAQPRPETQGEWTEALADVGAEDGGDVLVPSIGLERLQSALAMHSELGYASPKFRGVVKAVDKLADHSTEAVAALTGDATPGRRQYWSAQLTKEAAAVLKALRSVCKAADVP